MCDQFLLHRIEIHCVEDKKDEVLVFFYLWALVFTTSIFNGKRMQVKYFGNLGQLLLCRTLYIQPKDMFKIVDQPSNLIHLSQLSEGMLVGAAMNASDHGFSLPVI